MPPSLQIPHCSPFLNDYSLFKLKNPFQDATSSYSHSCSRFFLLSHVSSPIKHSAITNFVAFYFSTVSFRSLILSPFLLLTKQAWHSPLSVLSFLFHCIFLCPSRLLHHKSDFSYIFNPACGRGWSLMILEVLSNPSPSVIHSITF